MAKTAQLPLAAVSAPALSAEVMAELFEQLPEVAFYVKDRQGRYTAVNDSLLRRTGFRSRADLLGKTVRGIFPPDLARHYEAQDAAVLRTGRALRDQLELHWHPDRRRGWCLTTKLPLLDAQGRVTGLAGISRDVQPPDGKEAVPAAVAAAVEWLRAEYADGASAAGMARRAGMSAARFARITRRLFGLSPRQMISQTRIQAAASLLEAGRVPVAEVAVACGFTDHSAFTRAFRAAVGRTPTEHRRLMRKTGRAAPDA